MFWEPGPAGRARCLTCPNKCAPGEGGETVCRTRTTSGGKLVTLTYGKPCMLCTDPLTKNPLYHVDPGAAALGVATAGCNLHCRYCQNWDVSQVGPDRTTNFDVSPAQLIAKVRERGLKWITFSYTEPTAYLEYALDIGKLARSAGIRVAVSTAAYINPAPLRALMDVADAFSVTLKGYSETFYTEVCGCSLAEVWKGIRQIHAGRVWLELVTLIVPGMNDEPEGLQRLVADVAALDRSIPLHFLRFAPAFKLKGLQPTPVRTLESAREAGVKAGLKFVYIDLPGHTASATACPRCGTTLIERAGFTVIRNVLKRNACPRCAYRLPGVFPVASV